MLTDRISREIYEFVKLKPRSIQEISQHIKKNWRTTERYVQKLEDETGQLSTRIFREGTRGALKIVFWNSIEEIHSLSFQSELFDDIFNSQRKSDFSPFEIYQHVDQNKKKTYVEDVSNINSEDTITENQDLVSYLKKANKQIVIFSGNLSWINAHQGKREIIDVLRELAKKGIQIKVIARVSLIGVDNVKRLLSINKELGEDMIEVRHRYQPLRGIIIDDKIVKFREEKEMVYYPKNELDKDIEVFYDIYDKDWIAWLLKVFWKMFASAVPANKRIDEIDKIRKMFN